MPHRQSQQAAVGGGDLGALNLVSEAPAAFDHESEQVALLFAAHAAVAMAQVHGPRRADRPPRLAERRARRQPAVRHRPVAYKRWVQQRRYALVAPRVGQTRSRAQQLPSHESGRAVVKAIYDRCRPDPVSFEAVAAELWRMSAEGRVELDLTRPSRDGGRDAIGQLFVGPTDDQIGLGQLADTG